MIDLNVMLKNKYILASSIGLLACACVTIVIKLVVSGSQVYENSNIPKSGDTSFKTPSTSQRILDYELIPVPEAAIDNDVLNIEISGQFASFKAYTLEINQFSLPIEKGGSYLYEKLSERAKEGDSIASRMLASLLYRCRQTFINKTDYDNAISLLRKEKIYPTASSRATRVKVPDELIDDVENQLQGEYELCKNISEGKRSEADEWAILAMEGGDFLATEQLLNSNVISTSERFDVLERRWNEFGLVESAIEMAVVLSGVAKHKIYEGIEPDPKKAYAFFLLGTGVENAVLERSNPFEARQKDADAYGFEQILTSTLTPQEHLEAEQLAIELLEGNKKCCSYDPRSGYRVSSQ